MVMPLMNGGTLSDYISTGSLLNWMNSNPKLREYVIALLARDVLISLLDLHEKVLIIHCDVKPQNILVNFSIPTVIPSHLPSAAIPTFFLLCDLGCSKRMDSSDQDFRLFSGTLIYSSPEMAQLKAKGFEGKSFFNRKHDIWSLGMVLYETFNGKIIDELFTDVSYDTLALGTISTMLKTDEMTLELKDFLEKCLIIDKDTRPDAKDLLKHPFLLKYFIFNDVGQ
jgi:serine/threonine protein kinase